jgi:hypothetical protein
MLKKNSRQFLSTIVIVIALELCSYSSVSAFDTYWHSEAASKVGTAYGFSSDAIKALQFSSFALDYFWIFLADVESTVEKGLSYLEFRDLPTTAAERKASMFLHFDNLNLDLNQNWKFDYIWSRLLANTQNTITNYYNDSKLSADDKKKLILLTVGASLHTVEDFYCHSDWIHFDFAKAGFPALRSEDGTDRAPTWFEARQKFAGDSAKLLNLRLSSGIFPPKTDVPSSQFGVPLSHTPMNHDNSQLYFAGASQIIYHKFGLHPAQDSTSAAEHQLFAFHTAIYAANEWIKMIEQNSVVKEAIDYAKGWDLSKIDHDVSDDLEDGLNCILTASCLFQKWDGSYPPPERKNDCKPGKTLTHWHIPKQSNKFWGAFPKYKILENLCAGIGDKSGHYTFDSTGITVQK